MVQAYENMKRILLISLIFGFIYQWYDLTKNYFQYNIFNKLDVEVDANLMPSTTICVDKRYKYAAEDIKRLVDIYGDTIYKESLYLVDKLQIYFAFTNATILDGSNMNLFSQSNSGYNSMCVTLDLQSLLKQESMKYVFELSLSIYQYKRAYIIFHDHKEPPHFISYHKKLVLINNQQLNVGFDKRINTLLPFPYATDCRDYSSSVKHKSQKECLFEYMSRKELKVCGYNYIWNRKPFNVSVERFRLTRYEKRCHFDINHNWFNRLCKRDCDITEFNVKQQYYIISNYFGVKSVILKFMSYYIHTGYVPRIDLIAYLSTLGGLLSMWLGFNMWLFTVKTLKHFNWVRRVYTRYYGEHVYFINLLKTLKLIIKILQIFILLITIYQIGQILNKYLYSNKRMTIGLRPQLQLPKIIISFAPFINFTEHERYYPGITQYLMQSTPTGMVLLEDNLNYYFRILIRDNLSRFMQLQKIDQAIINCYIEYHNYTVSCPRHRTTFYFGSSNIVGIQVLNELFPYRTDHEYFLPGHDQEIQRIVIDVQKNIIYDNIVLLFQKSEITVIANKIWYEFVNSGQINNFVIETNSVQRLRNFNDKQCIQTETGLFSTDNADECIIDCANHRLNQTFGCLPVINAYDTRIRLERDLNYFRFDFCRKQIDLNKISNLYENCFNRCPSQCNILLFNVNHYTEQANLNNHTIINIIPKYSNELLYIESYRMSLFDLMYEIGGIVGLWFGWSAISLLQLSTILLIYLHKAFLHLMNFKQYCKPGENTGGQLTTSPTSSMTSGANI